MSKDLNKGSLGKSSGGNIKKDNEINNIGKIDSSISKKIDLIDYIFGENINKDSIKTTKIKKLSKIDINDIVDIIDKKSIHDLGELNKPSNVSNSMDADKEKNINFGSYVEEEQRYANELGVVNKEPEKKEAFLLGNVNQKWSVNIPIEKNTLGDLYENPIEKNVSDLGITNPKTEIKTNLEPEKENINESKKLIKEANQLDTIDNEKKEKEILMPVNIHKSKKKDNKSQQERLGKVYKKTISKEDYIKNELGKIPIASENVKIALTKKLGDLYDNKNNSELVDFGEIGKINEKQSETQTEHTNKLGNVVISTNE